MAQRFEELYWQEYMATHLWYLVSATYAIGGKDLQTPFYPEIIHKQPPEDPKKVKERVIKLFS